MTKNLTIYFDHKGRVLEHEFTKWTYRISVRFEKGVRCDWIYIGLYKNYEPIEMVTYDKNGYVPMSANDKVLDTSSLFKYLAEVKSKDIPDKIKDVYLKLIDKYILSQFVIRSK